MSGRTERARLAPAPASRFVLPRRASGVLAPAERELALQHVRALLERPTAPYFEDGPQAVVRAFVRAHEGFELEEDEHANLLVRWKGTRKAKKGAPLLAFSAHLDHPAFHYEGRRVARLHGGVPARFLPGAALRFFAPGEPEALATARIARVRKSQPDEPLRVELAGLRGRLHAGSFGVFDLPSGVIRGGRLFARVCDDLMGAAAILSTLDLLARARLERPVLGVFTRAEETGFVGCLGLMQSGALPKGTQVVGLECSPRRSTARVGRGPVIRAGDKLSLFDPQLTLAVEEAARSLEQRVPAFRWQRALMDGGSCESTVYNHFGTRAAGVCLALGNYHNCGPQGRIAPEFVSWDDYEGLVALLGEIARGFGASDPRAKIGARLQRIWAREYNLLEASSTRLRRGEPQ
jgi:endoglucanase